MRRLPLLFVLLLVTPTPAVAARKVLLVAHDLQDRPLPGVCFSYGGVVSAKTDTTGATELPLPSDHGAGRQIKILFVPCSKKAPDWFLVNSQINIPDATGSVDIVLMSRSIVRKIANEVSRAKAITAGRSEQKAAEDDPKKALVAAAAKYGLTGTQVETALASFAETKDVNDRGIALYLQGQYAQAEQVLKGPAEKEERDLVEKLRYLGLAQYEQGKYQLAAESFRRAVALRGDDAELISWLGRSLDQLAQWTEAESLMRHALAIDQKRLGADHPNVARDLNSLAQLLHSTNRLAEAEPLMRRALAIDEKSFGADHSNVARDLGSLALLLQATNRFGEAEPLMRRALAIDEKSFGADRPNLSRDLNNLGLLLQATNRLGEAEPLMRRALDIDEKNFGPDHPNVARDLNNLAWLLRAMSRLAEAEPLMRRVLGIYEKSFGSDHPNVAIALDNLALLLKATNRLDEAEPLMRRALEINEKSLGPNHTDVAISLRNLALLLQATNRFAEAESLMRRALQIDEASLGADHPDVATDLNNLEALLQATNRLAEAEPLARRALAIDEKSFGADHPDVATDLNNLAQLLKAAKRLEEAEQLTRRSLVILYEFFRRTGHEHPHFKTVQKNYTSLLKAMGKSPAEIDAIIESLPHPPGISGPAKNLVHSSSVSIRSPGTRWPRYAGAGQLHAS